MSVITMLVLAGAPLAHAEDEKTESATFEVAPDITFALGLGAEESTTSFGFSLYKPLGDQGDRVLVVEPGVVLPSTGGITVLPSALETPSFALSIGYGGESWTEGGPVDASPGKLGEVESIPESDRKHLISRDLGTISAQIGRSGYSWVDDQGASASADHVSWSVAADYLSLKVGNDSVWSPAFSVSYAQNWTAAEASTILTSPDGGVTWVSSEAILDEPSVATQLGGAASYASFRRGGHTPLGYGIRASGGVSGAASLDGAAWYAGAELWLFALPVVADQPNMRIGVAPALSLSEDAIDLVGLFELRLGSTRSVYELP